MPPKKAPCCQCKGNCADKRCSCTKANTPCDTCKSMTDRGPGCENPATPTYEMLKRENKQLKKKNEQLRREREEGGNAEATADPLAVLKKQIQSEREERTAREEHLMKKNQELTMENEKLNGKYQELKGKNRERKGKVTALEDELSALKLSNKVSQVNTSFTGLSIDTPTSTK